MFPLEYCSSKYVFDYSKELWWTNYWSQCCSRVPLASFFLRLARSQTSYTQPGPVTVHSWASSKAPLLFWWTRTAQAAKCQGSRFVWTIFEKPKSRAASFKWQSSKTCCLEPPKRGTDFGSNENDATVRVLPESGFSDASFCYASLLLASVLTRTAASILKDPFRPFCAAWIDSCCSRSPLKPLKLL